MRHWKLLLIVAIVGSGFATGYVWKNWSTPQVQPSAPDVAVHQPAPMPSGYDLSLILPPPETKGEMIDIPVADIRKHFREKAGLKSTDDFPPLEGPALPPIEPRPFPIGITLPTTTIVPVDAQLELPPIVETIEPTPLPPRVIRLPAPDEEPRSPNVRPVLHRQVGMWVYTNNRELRLNFDVVQKGPSGIKFVELWGRRSSDAEYECADQMEGDQPPFRSRLWSEGNYEFRMVFVSRTGMRTRTPKLSDEADIYVCLDTSAPVIEMQAPQAEAPGIIKLRWTAADKNIDVNPVSLSYSTDGELWLPLANSLPAEGEYRWTVPAGVPSEVHLRAEAKDKAGNIGVWRSSKTVAIDLTVPEGRISGYVERLPEPRAVYLEPATDFRDPPIYPEEKNGLLPVRELLPMPRVKPTTAILRLLTDGTNIGSRYLPRSRYAPWEELDVSYCEWLRGSTSKDLSHEIIAARGGPDRDPVIKKPSYLTPTHETYLDMLDPVFMWPGAPSPYTPVFQYSFGFYN